MEVGGLLKRLKRWRVKIGAWLSNRYLSPAGPLPNHYKTNLRFNLSKTTEAEGTADHVML